MCGDWTEMSSRDVKKVRKSRACMWCGERIEVGDAAFNITGIIEGEFDSQYYHPECNAACKQWFIDIEYADDCFVPYEFVRGLPMDKLDYRSMKAQEQTTRDLAHKDEQ